MVFCFLTCLPLVRMRSLILTACCFAVSFGTVPDETRQTFTDLATRYALLAVVTAATLAKKGGLTVEWDQILGHKFDIAPNCMMNEVTSELDKLKNAMKSVIARIESETEKDKLVYIPLEHEGTFTHILSSWLRLQSRISEFSKTLPKPIEVPPGRPGPPPAAPTTTSAPADIGSEWDDDI